MDLVKIANIIADYAFRYKKDLSGEPYINHLERVASNFPISDNDEPYIIAILHDLLEDCPEWNEDSLLCFFPQWIVGPIVTLTKQEGEDYRDYIVRVKQNSYARQVKIKDLLDNMDITRLDKITDGDVKRLRKYHSAYRYLRSDISDEDYCLGKKETEG